MNHLAHFYLASKHPKIPLIDSLTGAFLGDFIKGKLKNDLPEDIERGIRLHRRIDSFTDSHPIVKKGYDNFKPPLRRFAPIILDLVFDHLLARDWSSHHHQSLAEFNSEVFDHLQTRLEFFPDKARLQMLAMKEKQSLLGYSDESFLDRSLNYLSSRIRRKNPLFNSFELVTDALPELEQSFSSFFPDAIDFIELSES